MIEAVVLSLQIAFCSIAVLILFVGAILIFNNIMETVINTLIAWTLSIGVWVIFCVLSGISCRLICNLIHV